MNLPADAIHAYDQAFASSEEGLAQVIRSYRKRRALDTQHGRSEAETVMGMIAGFESPAASKQLLAALLAVAIVHFAATWPEEVT